MGGTDLRLRRLFPKIRHLAKRAWVKADSLYFRSAGSMKRWLPVLGKARAGHIVVPSRSVLDSRAEALDFVAHGLVGPGDRVLDVGAGNGRQAIGLLELCISSYTGLEVVKASVDYGNAAFLEFGQVRFVHFDVANDMYNPSGTIAPEQAIFPFDDGAFDFVVAGSLYTHLERLEVVARYIAETARVLEPSGKAFMSFFRNPPNGLTSSAVRSVFAEQDVLSILDRHFVVDASVGGASTDWHDQWRLYLTKR